MKAEEDPKHARDDEWRLPFPPPPRGEDLPCDDGEPMETERHRAQMNLIADSLAEGWKARRDFYSAGNMALYFSQLHAKRQDFRAPDCFVVLGVDPKERKSWVVWEEDGATPDVVIEILSESTESVDRGEKMRIYEKVLKVAVYVLYEPFSHLIEVYELDATAKAYRRVPMNASGRFPCAPLGLELGLWDGKIREIDTRWLRWFTPEGELIELLREQALRHVEEVQRRAEEVQRRAEEDLRHAEEARRELDDARQQADEERWHAEEERHRADEERRRAEEERQRADQQRRHAEEERQRADEALRTAAEALRRAEAVEAELAAIRRELAQKR